MKPEDLTDEQIQALADEAEAGYDPDQLKPAPCPTIDGVSKCAILILAGAWERGTDLKIGTERPIASAAVGYRCPHGTKYWIWPTEQQIRAWENTE